MSPPPSRPDASMSLLVDLMNRDALDAGYAQAAARRADRRPVGAARWGSAGRATVLVALGVLLAVGAHSLGDHAPAVVRARDALVADVRSRTAATDQLAARIAALRAQTDRARDRALAATATGGVAATRLRAAELAAAALPVTGPGVQVVLDDAPSTDGGQAGLGTVLDTDLDSVVNALWASGAEAVAVSGQRLSAVSAIRSAGSAILVDFRPVSRPYVVTAIGATHALQARFEASRAAHALRRLADAVGLRFSDGTVGSVTLPAAPGLVVRNAHVGGRP